MGAPEDLRRLLTDSLSLAGRDCNHLHHLGESIDLSDRVTAAVLEHPALVRKALTQHENRQALLAEG